MFNDNFIWMKSDIKNRTDIENQVASIKTLKDWTSETFKKEIFSVFSASLENKELLLIILVLYIYILEVYLEHLNLF